MRVLGLAISFREVRYKPSWHTLLIYYYPFPFFCSLTYHSGGTLSHHCLRWGGMSEPMALFYAAEICVALLYLHGEGIMHRDLKLSNILLSKEVCSSGW